MDFQNRDGSKPGAGGPASTMAAAMALKQKQLELGMEMIDLDKVREFVLVVRLVCVACC